VLGGRNLTPPIFLTATADPYARLQALHKAQGTTGESLVRQGIDKALPKRNSQPTPIPKPVLKSRFQTSRFNLSRSSRDGMGAGPGLWESLGCSLVWAFGSSKSRTREPPDFCCRRHDSRP